MGTETGAGEPLYLVDELGEGCVSLQQYMISAVQGHESCTRDETGQVATLLERDPSVADRM